MHEECRRQLPKESSAIFPERIYSHNRGGSLRGERVVPDRTRGNCWRIFKIAILPTWELTFGELRPPISRHFQTLLLIGPRVTFGSLLESPGVIGVFWVILLGCPWRPRAILLGAFGSPRLSVGLLLAPFCNHRTAGGEFSAHL